MSHRSTSSRWSTPLRMSSPWLMSCVHFPPGNDTFAGPANGWFSAAASAVHGPARLGDVQDRK